MLDSEKDQLNAAVNGFVNGLVAGFAGDEFTEEEVIVAFNRAQADLIASAGISPEQVRRMVRHVLQVGYSRDAFAVAEADRERLTRSNVVQHMPDDRKTRLRFSNSRHAEPRASVVECISCCLHGGYNLASRGVEILTALAERKRPLCRAAGRCLDTGIPMKGNEPPQAENCECNLTREVVYTLFDISGLLEGVLDKADRLALMVERGANPPRNTTT